MVLATICNVLGDVAMPISTCDFKYTIHIIKLVLYGVCILLTTLEVGGYCSQCRPCNTYTR